MSSLRVQLQSFTRNICDGFVRFQQSGDFVDMTLAAEGHLVKVHKNILSLSSPYIEEMLKTIPCKHPVLFLNNVTHEILTFILEYVYTGVVSVPRNRMEEFVTACKQLHIIGVKDYKDVTLLAPSLNMPSNDNENLKKPTIYSYMNRPISKNPFTTQDGTNCDLDENPAMEIDDHSNNNNTTEREFDNTRDMPESPIRIVPVKDKVSSNAEVPKAMYQIDLSKVGQDTAADLNDMKLIAKLIENSPPVTKNNNHNSVQYVSSQNPAPGESEYGENPGTYDDEYSENPAADDYDAENPAPIQSTNFLHCVKDVNILGMPFELAPFGAPSLALIDGSTPVFITPDNPPQTSHQMQEKQKAQDVIAIKQTQRVSANTENDGDCPRPDLGLPSSGLTIPDGAQPLYMLSNRGSLQMVLNRFLYGLHHNSYGSRKRRWRCIYYRRSKCKAYVDTECETITSRAFAHNHGLHDKEILKKGRRGAVFTTIALAKAHAESERSETTGDQRQDTDAGSNRD